MPSLGKETITLSSVPETSLAGKALRSGLFITISKIIRYGFVFLTHLVLMNILTPADFGMMRYVTIVLGFVNLINEAGLKLAIVQKKDLEKNEVASSFCISIVFSIGLYGVIYLLAPQIALYAGNSTVTNLIRVGGLAAPIGGLSIVQRGLMQREFRFARLSFIEVIAACCGSIVGLLLAFSGWGVWSLVTSVVIYTMVSSSICIITVGIPAGNFFDFKSTVKLIRFGTLDVVNKFIGYVTMNADYLIVGRYFGTKVLGLYGFAFSIIILGSTVFGVVANGVALSTYSRLQGDSERVQSMFLKLTKMLSLFFVPFFIIIVVLPTDIITTISFIKHNGEWIPAVPYVKILAPMALLYILGGFPIWVWTAMGQNRVRTMWELFSLVTIVITVFIGAQHGVVHVCIALLVRSVIMFPIGLIIDYRTFGLHPMRHIKKVMSPVVCGSITMVFALFFSNVTVYTGTGAIFVHLLTNSCLVLFLYFALIFILYRDDIRELKSFVRESGLIKTKYL